MAARHPLALPGAGTCRIGTVGGKARSLGRPLPALAHHPQQAFGVPRFQLSVIVMDDLPGGLKPFDIVRPDAPVWHASRSPRQRGYVPVAPQAQREFKRAVRASMSSVNSPPCTWCGRLVPDYQWQQTAQMGRFR